MYSSCVSYFDLVPHALDIPNRIEEGVKKIAHSKMVAIVVGIDPKTVRPWVKDFCKGAKFMLRKREYNKRQPHSYIDDKDIYERLREFIGERIYWRKKRGSRLRVADIHSYGLLLP